MNGFFNEQPIAGPAPKGLGRMMTGGGAKVDRQGNDYYPTPASVTRAFIAAERECLRDACKVGDVILERPVWEPCGRGGAISGELERAGFATIATDLVADPANLVAQQDLLLCRQALSPVVVTNPPFALAAEMIRHLLNNLGCTYVAMLLKSSFWHAEVRTGLWRQRTPARIYALNWRPDFLGKGNPTMEVIWCVWDAAAIDNLCAYDVLTPFRAPDLLGEE
ncbi:hypothetical protein BV98_000567 [Sphingobium herbicidovorans NBRC 16415]|uniref:Methyltransferase n=1 Tax=Sphingobium herbicidovorans (strain ATCC 700291 / DSM 11019 / CCUG 56400 / KCTC 2939 / LMG 18315 / NBRC 16415 / MH) TaxID=1219045 RepID=A0A086PE91_SPHHM|nr:hypothetical protein [Sphingobium herbicidovorans]KFG91709.1 hypothetical protein BV98_000567 [Sphingobium herbicidovorans NBRC 16415]